MLEQPISPATDDQLLDHPEMRKRLLTLNIVIGAFLIAPVFYIWLLTSGTIPTTEELPYRAVSLWQVMVGISVTMILPMFLTGMWLLKRVASASRFVAAFVKGQTTITLVLAFAQAVCIYGLIMPILGAPIMVAYGLIALGILYSVIGLLFFRPKVLSILLVKLAEEEKGEAIRTTGGRRGNPTRAIRP